MARSSGPRSIFSDYTGSKIPKTPRERRMFVQARRLEAKMTGRTGIKDQSWGLIVKIYKDELKANKIIKDKEIRKQKVIPRVRKDYRTDIPRSKMR